MVCGVPLEQESLSAKADGARCAEGASVGHDDLHCAVQSWAQARPHCTRRLEDSGFGAEWSGVGSVPFLLKKKFP